jgi:hypothetical protein
MDERHGRIIKIPHDIRSWGWLLKVGFYPIATLAKWANPNERWLLLANLFDGGGFSLDTAAGSNAVFLTLLPSECRAYSVESSPALPPTILVNDPSFGFHANKFGFSVSAFPGQWAFIQRATNLQDWITLQANLVPASGLIFFHDLDSRAFPRQYYRVNVQTK